MPNVLADTLAFIFTLGLQINTMPVQESSQESDLELIRRKRLERLVSGGSDNPDSPKSEKAVLSTPNSSGVSEVMKPSGNRELVSGSPPVQGFKRSSSSPRFEVGDVVKVEGKKSLYGVVKWVGNIPGVEGNLAGIETVWIWFTAIAVRTHASICVN